MRITIELEDGAQLETNEVAPETWEMVKETIAQNTWLTVRLVTGREKIVNLKHVRTISYG